MRQWFRDGVFRAVLRNAGYLGSTKLVGAGLNLIALSCAGRGLGPELFGVMILLHTYALSVNAIVKFQSWQVIIRYGAPAIKRDDKATVMDSIRFAFGLDIISGIVGMLGAMVVLPFLAPHLGIDRHWVPLGIFYCTLIPTMAAATSTGVMRLFDRFDLIAAQQTVTPIIRAVGIGGAFLLGLGFPVYVLVWYAADIIGDIILWVLTVQELGRREMLHAMRPGLFGTARRMKDSWSFVWTTNLSISLDAAWGPVGNLVVGGVLGPVAAGLYRIAETLIDSAGKPADLLTKGFYPEIMRLDPGSKQPWRLAVRTGALAGGIGLAVVLLILVGGKPLIGAAFGHKYLAAYGVVSLMMFALMVSMATFPLKSLLYMVGRQRAALAAEAAASILYIVLLALFAKIYGLNGAGSAYVLGTSALAAFLVIPVMVSYRGRKRYALPILPPAVTEPS